MEKKADMVIDLQYGSTGKGLIAGYLAKRRGYDTVINANMPNAGHTFIDVDGRKWIHKVLPNGIVSPDLKRVMIGPGSVFSPERMRQEIDESADLLENAEIMIHPAACVLNYGHVITEERMLNSIASTMQGSAAASIEKMMRNRDSSPLARDNAPILADYGLWGHVTTEVEWAIALRAADNILIEAAQGYSLGINAGFWPYCTSRDCTPARFMADCGVPLPYLRSVIGTARTYPIRVGNTKDGFSGDHYSDQEEIEWEDIGVAPELTTVTGRVRRIFTFSWIQIEEAIFACQPNEIFINFCNYVGTDDIGDYLECLEGALFNFGPSGSSVRYLGWGPSEQDIQQMVG